MSDENDNEEEETVFDARSGCCLIMIPLLLVDAIMLYDMVMWP